MFSDSGASPSYNCEIIHTAYRNRRILFATIVSQVRLNSEGLA